MVGVLYFRLHALPERFAHKKVQFEIVCVLALLAMFTHMHIFWIAGLLLALIDFPDFSGLLRRIAGSTEKIADKSPRVPEGETAPGALTVNTEREDSPEVKQRASNYDLFHRERMVLVLCSQHRGVVSYGQFHSNLGCGRRCTDRAFRCLTDGIHRPDRRH